MLCYDSKAIINVLIRGIDIKKDYRLWITTPYIKGKFSKKCCASLFKNYEKINQKIFLKFNIKLPKKEIVNKWYNLNLFPILLLPYIGLRLDYNQIEGVCGRRDSSFFKLFKIKLDNPNLFYIVGCLAGDGNISRNVLSIYDGYYDKKYLSYSKRFLINIKKLFIEVFGVNEYDIKIYKHKTQNNYILRIDNKWLIRFFNYYFNFPYGKKKNANLSPYNFKIVPPDLESEKSLCQGLLDTDGSINKNVKNISFVSQNEELLLWARDLFLKLGIQMRPIRQIKNSKELKIPVLGFREFSRQIGFRHPRKKMILEKHDLRPIHIIEFQGIKKENLYQQYFDIFAINNLRLFPAGWLIKKIKDKLELNGNELGKKIGLSQPFISEIETNKKSLPLSNFLKTILLVYNKEEFYNELIQQKCLFVCRDGGGGPKKVNLPLLQSKEIDDIAKNIKVSSKYCFYFKKDNNLKRKVENLFNINITKETKYNYEVNNKIINQFFNTFYIYNNRL